MHNRYEAPIDGYQEQCFYHDMAADADGFVTVILANRAFGGGQGLGMYLRYRQAELPILPSGRWSARGPTSPAWSRQRWVEGALCKDCAEGLLQFLEPGESRETLLEIGVLGSNAEIDALAKV